MIQRHESFQQAQRTWPMSILPKALTTKWPLCLVLMQMTESLIESGLLVKLSWRPRDKNILVDSTNFDFSAVTMEDRIKCFEGGSR